MLENDNMSDFNLAQWFEECEEGFAERNCDKKLLCGHTCCGVSHSDACLPCMELCCSASKINKNELCAICYTSELGDEPCIELGCGHIYHAGCVKQLIEHGWSTLKISFAFMSCPECKAPIESSRFHMIRDQINTVLQLKAKVESEALKVAERQGLLQDERLSNLDDFYFEKPLEYALHRCAFYACFTCKEPFFGGLIDCE